LFFATSYLQDEESRYLLSKETTVRVEDSSTSFCEHT